MVKDSESVLGAPLFVVVRLEVAVVRGEGLDGSNSGEDVPLVAEVGLVVVVRKRLGSGLG